MASLDRRHEAEVDLSDEGEDTAKRTNQTSNPAYGEFLQFLRLGCGGSAVSFYPAIVVIISKLPESVRSTLTMPMVNLQFNPVVSCEQGQYHGAV